MPAEVCPAAIDAEARGELPSAPSPAAHEATGLRSRVLAIAQHLGAVHEDVHHPGRVLVRPVERGVVLNALWREHCDVRVVAGLKRAALREAEVRCGQ